VEQGAPAASSGLRADDLILSANGRPLLTVDDLQRAMVLAAGPALHLRVDRAGEDRFLVVFPAARPKAA
jgi:S1-C subfamily serine protease